MSPFDISASITGFCRLKRDPRSASRTQRVIMSLARRMASFANMTDMLQVLQPCLKCPLKAALNQIQILKLKARF